MVNRQMKTFIENMPKAELHVHIEGTLEPELSFALAQKNGVTLNAKTPEEMIAAYNFHDLPSFLDISEISKTKLFRRKIDHQS